MLKKLLGFRKTPKVMVDYAGRPSTEDPLEWLKYWVGCHRSDPFAHYAGVYARGQIYPYKKILEEVEQGTPFGRDYLELFRKVVLVRDPNYPYVTFSGIIKKFPLISGRTDCAGESLAGMELPYQSPTNEEIELITFRLKEKNFLYEVGLRKGIECVSFDIHEPSTNRKGKSFGEIKFGIFTEGRGSYISIYAARTDSRIDTIENCLWLRNILPERMIHPPTIAYTIEWGWD